MNYSRRILIIVMLVVGAGCRETLVLSGTVAITETPYLDVALYYPVSGERFALGGDSVTQYTPFRWAHTTDHMTGVVLKNSRKYGTIGGSIMMFDRAGVARDTLYTSAYGEVPGNAYLSWNDSLLVFALFKRYYDENRPFAGLSQPASMLIMDVTTKKIIMRTDSMASYLQFRMGEWPWRSDCRGIVYAVSSSSPTINRSFQPLGYKPLDIKPGVYYYDLTTRSSTLLAEGGTEIICSPVDNKIAFVRDNKVWIYQSENEPVKMLYNPGNKSIVDLRWSPDGKYIFTAGTSVRDLRLIRVTDGEKFDVDRLFFSKFEMTWR